MLLGTVRMKGKYDYILSSIYNGDYRTLKSKLKNILRLACYQIDKMDSIPNHAAVSTSVDITKKTLSGYHGLVNALLRKFIDIKNDYSVDLKDKRTYKVLSHPSWIVNKWVEDFGITRTVKLCEYNNQNPSVWFRINNLDKIESIIEKTKNRELQTSMLSSQHSSTDATFFTGLCILGVLSPPIPQTI